MKRGYLYFDIRRGLESSMLNAAMAALLPDLQCINRALKEAGLFELKVVVNKVALNGLSAKTIHLYYGEKIIEPSSKNPLLIKDNKIIKNKPRWDRSTAIEKAPLVVENVSKDLKASSFLGQCLGGESISLLELKNYLSTTKLEPTSLNLALKIVEELICDSFAEQRLAGHDALWLISQLLMMVSQLNELDPLFISATKVMLPYGFQDESLSNTLSLNDDRWIKQLLLHVPAIEVANKNIVVDVLALAFLKATCGRFGARGESTISSIGVGISKLSSGFNGSLVECLWCEPALPDTMAELSSKKSARVNAVYELRGIVASGVDINQLMQAMFLHGARSLSYLLVHDQKNGMQAQLSMLVNDERKHEVLEAFLIKAGAKNVIINTVEQHELQKRLVSVPLGTGNKVIPYQFYEYLYADKVVRVEPTKEDLDNYVARTDYSVDVARSDLLMAWKKWRGRMVAEEI